MQVNVTANYAHFVSDVGRSFRPFHLLDSQDKIRSTSSDSGRSHSSSPSIKSYVNGVAMNMDGLIARNRAIKGLYSTMDVVKPTELDMPLQEKDHL